jgi:hypothetical protein
MIGEGIFGLALAGRVFAVSEQQSDFLQPTLSFPVLLLSFRILLIALQLIDAIGNFVEATHYAARSSQRIAALRALLGRQ